MVIEIHMILGLKHAVEHLRERELRVALVVLRVNVKPDVAQAHPLGRELREGRVARFPLLERFDVGARGAEEGGRGGGGGWRWPGGWRG